MVLRGRVEEGALTFPEFISELESRNPRLFEAKEIKIKVSSLREQLKRAYTAGAEQAVASKMFDELFPTLHKK